MISETTLIVSIVGAIFASTGFWAFLTAMIQRGDYVYAEMYDMLDVLLLGGRITQTQYTELVGMMVNPAA